MLSELITRPELVSAEFAFDDVGQSGRLAFHATGTWIGGGVNLSTFATMEIGVTAGGPAYDAAAGVKLVLASGDADGCEFVIPLSGVVDLTSPDQCYGASLDYTNLTQVQIGISSDSADIATLTVTDIQLFGP